MVRKTQIMQIMHRLVRGRDTGQFLINHTISGSPLPGPSINKSLIGPTFIPFGP